MENLFKLNRIAKGLKSWVSPTAVKTQQRNDGYCQDEMYHSNKVNQTTPSNKNPSPPKLIQPTITCPLTYYQPNTFSYYPNEIVTNIHNLPNQFDQRPHQNIDKLPRLPTNAKKSEKNMRKPQVATIKPNNNDVGMAVSNNPFYPFGFQPQFPQQISNLPASNSSNRPISVGLKNNNGSESIKQKFHRLIINPLEKINHWLEKLLWRAIVELNRISLTKWLVNWLFPSIVKTRRQLRKGKIRGKAIQLMNNPRQKSRFQNEIAQTRKNRPQSSNTSQSSHLIRQPSSTCRPTLPNVSQVATNGPDSTNTEVTVSTNPFGTYSFQEYFNQDTFNLPASNLASDRSVGKGPTSTRIQSKRLPFF